MDDKIEGDENGERLDIDWEREYAAAEARAKAEGRICERRTLLGQVRVSDDGVTFDAWFVEWGFDACLSLEIAEEPAPSGGPPLVGPPGERVFRFPFEDVSALVHAFRLGTTPRTERGLLAARLERNARRDRAKVRRSDPAEYRRNARIYDRYYRPKRHYEVEVMFEDMSHRLPRTGVRAWEHVFSRFWEQLDAWAEAHLARGQALPPGEWLREHAAMGDPIAMIMVERERLHGTSGLRDESEDRLPDEVERVLVEEEEDDEEEKE